MQANHVIKGPTKVTEVCCNTGRKLAVLVLFLETMSVFYRRFKKSFKAIWSTWNFSLLADIIPCTSLKAQLHYLPSRKKRLTHVEARALAKQRRTVWCMNTALGLSKLLHSTVLSVKLAY